MVSIEIDEEVMEELKNIAIPFEDKTPNDLIKRLIKCYTEKQPTPAISSTEIKQEPLPVLTSTDPLHPPDVMVHLEGKHLCKRFNGADYYVEVKNRKFVSDDYVDDTPSGAAMHITSYPVNGWHWWKYYDSNKNQWLEIDNLRRITNTDKA